MLGAVLKLTEKRALFGGAHAERFGQVDKWVSLVVAVGVADVTDMDRQCVSATWDVAQQHCDCPFRRSKQQVIPVLVCVAGADRHR